MSRLEQKKVKLTGVLKIGKYFSKVCWFWKLGFARPRERDSQQQALLNLSVVFTVPTWSE